MKSTPVLSDLIKKQSQKNNQDFLIPHVVLCFLVGGSAFAFGILSSLLEMQSFASSSPEMLGASSQYTESRELITGTLISDLFQSDRFYSNSLTLLNPQPSGEQTPRVVHNGKVKRDSFLSIVCVLCIIYSQLRVDRAETSKTRGPHCFV